MNQLLYLRGDEAKIKADRRDRNEAVGKGITRKTPQKNMRSGC